MVTATEVGGDYVDVRTDGRGGAQLAVGDATSHGLHAGMVVAVAKSLFLGGSATDQPLEVLRRVGAGLTEMHDRRASMTLAVLRFTPGGVHVASAGMPPVLVLRHNTSSVEEVLLPGVPLGTLAHAEHQQREIHVGPGDTLLVMTDGLPEATNPDGEVFGYERAAEVFASLGGRPASEVVDGMLKAVSSHLAGRSPQDDVTVVAAVARGH
jgi:serine phosphatase RsbU (regulator of sigma subunit)